MIEYATPVPSPIESISDKQWSLMVFPYSDYDICIAEGAVRSGKTIFSMISFIDWAMRTYQDRNFAICGYSVRSVERNIVLEYTKLAYARERYSMRLNRAQSVLVVDNGVTSNSFYIFGGGNKRSYEAVQGLTLAGALIDEVVLLDESFVNQVLTRLSVPGNRCWFTCNPASQQNWFYKRWIDRNPDSDGVKILRLHFTLDDNPGLDDAVYRQLTSRWSKKSTHYRWYILGEWVSPDGLIYDNFNKHKNVVKKLPDKRSLGRWYVSCDYGITNPFAALLWYVDRDRAYIADEVYIDPGAGDRRRTDEELYDALVDLIGDRKIECIVIDPSASSLKELIKRRHRYRVKNASNEVMPGISTTYSMLGKGLIKVLDSCTSGVLHEVYLYLWDTSGNRDREAPRKENDHAMDAMRYFAHTILRKQYARKY